MNIFKQNSVKKLYFTNFVLFWLNFIQLNITEFSLCQFVSALIDFFFPRKDEVDDQKSELSTLKSKVEDLKEDANKKNEMIGVSVTK